MRSTVWILLIFSFSCSSLSPVPERIRKKEGKGLSSQMLGNILRNAPPRSGPTEPRYQKKFVDRTQDWGLAAKKAVHLYAVDFNGDGFQDLVLLPDHYSHPEFLLYHPREKKFLPFLSPFQEPLKASFLSFHDFNKDSVMDVLVGTLNQKTEMSKFPLRLFWGKKKGS